MGSLLGHRLCAGLEPPRRSRHVSFAIANDTFEVNVVTKDSGWSLWHTWWGSLHQ